MKKIIFAVLLVCVAGIAAAGCIDTETPAGAVTPTPEVTQASGNQTETAMNSSRILIAYFSRTGNTEAVARMIAEETGGTLFPVTTVESYPSDYTEATNVARAEQEQNARPELAVHVDAMEEYDVIFLGYPIWWGTMPMAMWTFLEEYDVTGKTIVPFCTHGGSGFGRSISDITTLAPGATLRDGFACPGSSARDAGDDVAAWVAGLNLSVHHTQFP